MANAKFLENQLIEDKAVENTQNMTVLQLMERVALMAENCGLSDSFQEDVEPYAAALGKHLDITPIQAVLYSVILDQCGESKLRLSTISEYIGVRNARFMQYRRDIDALERKRYIFRSESGSGSSKDVLFYVPKEALDALNHNQAYESPSLSNLGYYECMNRLSGIFNERYFDGRPYNYMEADVLALIEGNQHHKVCKNLLALKRDWDSIQDWMLVVALCCKTVMGDGSLCAYDLKKIFDGFAANVFLLKITNNSSLAQKEGFVELCLPDDPEDLTTVTLTDKARNALFGEHCQKKSNVENVESQLGDLRDFKKIAKKSMFYPANVAKQIDQLERALSDKSFNEICKRFKAKGMRRGFTYLFYGAPGTGKTETVYQLARMTGRHIMQVDMSKVRDEYVGGSEKKVKAIFNEYRKVKKCFKKCPILLLNEADALIGKRTTNVHQAWDKMENTMQNILLQQMEEFEGILIATTNLEGNFDGAFDRRFFDKVRFEQPDAEVRQKIWQSLMPTLPDKIASALSREHNFSGGQIENVVRKQTLNEILNGESADLYASMKELCKNEKLLGTKSRSRMGFGA